jgi:superfamily II DNA/RNA helicase
MNDELKYESKALHGDVPQNTRESTMEAFRQVFLSLSLSLARARTALSENPSD